ncbi:MAG: hypothetical protein KF726_03980 [Anaerolineae bacterium]|nr:hypothetical protein [Anaerolineae bacterium]
MRPSKFRPVLLLAVACIIALAAFSSSLQFSASAQEGISPQTSTPQPPPEGNGGSATWTVEDVIFNSEYPNGGKFNIKASSSAGNIVSAAVVYMHNPSSKQRAFGRFDQESGYWIADFSGNGVPQWVAMDYYWQLTDEAGNTYQTDMVNDNYADTRREWNMAESEDIIVYWERTLPEELGQTVIDAMRDRRDFYYNAWGKLLSYRPRAILFNGDQPAVINEWAQGTTTQAQGSTSYLGGFTTRGYGAFVGFYYASRGMTDNRFAYGTVLHEVGHLYQFENGGFGGAANVWFSEGDAEYNSADRSGLRRALQDAQDLAASGDLPPLSEIGSVGRMAYDVGYSFFAWFTEKYGEGAHLELMQLIGRGTGVIKSLERYTGMSFVEIETEFRTWLGAPNAAPPTIAPTPTFLMFASPTFIPTKAP